MHKFYIGQKVVAIEDHPINMFKKDDIFIVTGIAISNCSCKEPLITIGIASICHTFVCKSRLHVYTTYTPEALFSTSRFAPIQEELSETSFEEALELVQEKKSKLTHKQNEEIITNATYGYTCYNSSTKTF